MVYEVELREPALALRRGDSTWVADAGGVVYDEVGKRPKGVPLVRVAEEPQALSRETVRGLVELWSLRPDAPELEGELSIPTYAASSGAPHAPPAACRPLVRRLRAAMDSVMRNWEGSAAWVGWGPPERLTPVRIVLLTPPSTWPAGPRSPSRSSRCPPRRSRAAAG